MVLRITLRNWEEKQRVPWSKQFLRHGTPSPLLRLIVCMSKTLRSLVIAKKKEKRKPALIKLTFYIFICLNIPSTLSPILCFREICNMLECQAYSKHSVVTACSWPLKFCSEL